MSEPCSEAQLDWARENFFSATQSQTVTSRVPFGKYEGEFVAMVPLRYLFETICDMRPSLFIFAVRDLLKSQWFIEESLKKHTNDRFQYLGDVVWMDVFNSYMDRVCPLKRPSSEC